MSGIVTFWSCHQSEVTGEQREHTAAVQDLKKKKI